MLLSPSVAVVESGCASKTTDGTDTQRETEVVITTVAKRERPQGVVSSALSLVGDVLAMPFRAERP